MDDLKKSMTSQQKSNAKKSIQYCNNIQEKVSKIDTFKRGLKTDKKLLEFQV